jgi:hypothetical protein
MCPMDVKDDLPPSVSTLCPGEPASSRQSRGD